MSIYRSRNLSEAVVHLYALGRFRCRCRSSMRKARSSSRIASGAALSKSLGAPPAFVRHSLSGCRDVCPEDTVHLGGGNAAAPTKAEGASPADGRRLDAIRARGKRLCGVNTGLLGFSTQAGFGRWAGLDDDFCGYCRRMFQVDPFPLRLSHGVDAGWRGRVSVTISTTRTRLHLIAARTLRNGLGRPRSGLECGFARRNREGGRFGLIPKLTIGRENRPRFVKTIPCIAANSVRRLARAAVR